MSRSVETTSSGGSAQSGSGGSADAVTATTGLRKIVAASMAGTVVEWYEFFLYATAASLVFGTFFFPNAGTRLDGIIAAFLMGCLPGYNTIGYWAPALLVALRFIQGFAVGGKWGGAVLLVAEHSPDKSRGFWSSWPQAAVPVGNLLATLALLTMSWILPNDQFLSWGWRLAFWLSAVIVVIGYYIRSHVNEAPIFLGARAQVEAEKAVSHGVTEVVKKYPRRVLPAMGLRFAENTLYYIIVSFSIVYLVTIHQYNTSQLLLALLIAHFAHFLLIPQVGRLSDRLGRKPIYLTGAVLGATWAFFAFPMFDSLNPVVIVLAITIGLIFHAFMYAGQPAIMSGMFPTRMRYSGVSLGYQVTSILAGSLAPIIASALLQHYMSWVPVAIYIAIACTITAATVLTLREMRGLSLRGVDSEDALKHGLAPISASSSER